VNRREERLIEFHRVYGQPIITTPQVPPEDRVKLRLKMLIEEAYECIESCYGKDDLPYLHHMKRSVQLFIDNRETSVNLPELADGLGDLDVIVEGTRLEFGIEGEPIAEAIHAANMAKVGPHGEVVKRADGKILKPEGWKPPDIEGKLKEQGWVPIHELRLP
jgi:predicted HAD superfamily Cof-like phosphohydrolase